MPPEDSAPEWALACHLVGIWGLMEDAHKHPSPLGSRLP